METSREEKAINDSYEELKTHIIEHVRRRQISTDVITDLKNSFKEQINSRRRLSYIGSIEDLISVLEKRDELNAFKVDHLSKIISTIDADKSKYVSHRKLISSGSSRVTENSINVLDDKGDNHVHPTQGCCSQRERNADVHVGYIPVMDSQRQQCNHHMYSVPNNYRSRLQPEVTDLICNDIGYKWKDLARSLEVKEGIIDEIDTTYRTSSTKCRVMLEEYEKTVKHCEIKIKLLKALTKARRKDLTEKVQSLLV